MHHRQHHSTERRRRRLACRKDVGGCREFDPQTKRSCSPRSSWGRVQTGENGGYSMSQDFQRISSDVKLGDNVRLGAFINLYGCSIGDHTKIGAFVEIQKNASVGRRCKVSSHTFVCEGVTIEDNVFIGHGVAFINDSYPRATTAGGELQTQNDWRLETTVVKRG